MIRGCRKLDFSASNISNFDHGACGHVACVLVPSLAKYKTCSYLLICKLYLYQGVRFSYGWFEGRLVFIN